MTSLPSGATHKPLRCRRPPRGQVEIVAHHLRYSLVLPSGSRNTSFTSPPRGTTQHHQEHIEHLDTKGIMASDRPATKWRCSIATYLPVAA